MTPTKMSKSRMRKPFTLASVEIAAATVELAAQESAKAPEPEPAAPPAPPTPPAQVALATEGDYLKFSLFQIINKESRAFGVIFSLGGATDAELHGYYLTPGPTKNFITAPVADCKLVGMGEVKSHNATSPEWNKLHEQSMPDVST